MRAEIDRLRQILWEIARMTGYEGPDEAPPAGATDPDVPEAALDSVKAYCSEYLSYTGPQGSDINPAAGPDDRCRCGQAITWLNRRWMHLFNEALGTGERHTPRPATGSHVPEQARPEEPVTFSTGEDIEAIRVLQQRLEEQERQAPRTRSRYHHIGSPGEFTIGDPRATQPPPEPAVTIQDDEEGPF
jgi:hypothetical protein